MFSLRLVLCICCLDLVAPDTDTDRLDMALLQTNMASNSQQESVGNHTHLRKGIASFSTQEEGNIVWPIVVPLTRQLVPVLNSVGTKVSYKSTYFGTLSLGVDQSQVFSMVFDTGSSQVIVPSSKCTSQACVKHRRFDRGSSTSAMDIEADGTEVVNGQERDTVVVGFGTGQVVGEFVKETVCLGAVSDMRRGGHCMQDLKLIAATEMSDKPFASFTFDGVVGLGLPVGAVHPSFSFLHMLSSYPSHSHTFSPQVGIFVDGRDGPHSEISFGGVNAKRLKSPLHWSTVVSPEQGHWQIPLKGIRVGGVAVDICGNEGCKAIVDTGTSHLAVPTSIYASLQQSLTLRHPFGSIAECGDSTGPELELDLGEFSLSLGTKEYSKRVPVLATTSNQSSAQEGICWPQIMKFNAPIGPNVFILGEPVLRKYYTAFDWVENKVGFAVSSQMNDEEEEVISLVQVRVMLRRSPKKVSVGVEMKVTSIASCPPALGRFIEDSPSDAELL